MESASDLILYRCHQEVWKRGEAYMRAGAVELEEWDDKQAIAAVHGSGDYVTRLAFRSGGLSRHCNCPFNGDFCKHMVAVAIVWDQKRGLKTPSPDEVEAESIPPPLVTRHDIDRMYKDPLHADLNIMRTLADEVGDWHRSHKTLPVSPTIIDNLNAPLDLEEIKQAAKQFKQWSRASNFDPYFCAGEMVAAFCALVRIIIQRVPVTDPATSINALLELENLHQEIILEMIDDSDGLHLFGSVHLEDLYDKIEPTLRSATKRDDLKKTFLTAHDNW
ncbi:MAG: SWIM zinc finger family protein [Candidatus Saccharimonadales bacterium]